MPSSPRTSVHQPDLGYLPLSRAPWSQARTREPALACSSGRTSPAEPASGVRPADVVNAIERLGDGVDWEPPRTSSSAGELETPFVSAPSSPIEPLRPAPTPLATQRLWAWLTGTVDRLVPWATPSVDASLSPTGSPSALAFAQGAAQARAVGEVHVDASRLHDLLTEASEPARRHLLFRRLFAESGPSFVLDRAATDLLAEALANGGPRMAMHALQLDPLTRYVLAHPTARGPLYSALGLNFSADQPLPSNVVTLVRERARSRIDGARVHVHVASPRAWDLFDPVVRPEGSGPTYVVAISVLPPAPVSPRASLPTGRSASVWRAPPPAQLSSAHSATHRRQAPARSWQQRLADAACEEQRMPLLEAPSELGILGTLYRTAQADFLLPISHHDAGQENMGWYKPHGQSAVPLDRA